jgi:hypothetical protein
MIGEHYGCKFVDLRDSLSRRLCERVTRQPFVIAKSDRGDIDSENKNMIREGQTFVCRRFTAADYDFS